jgi:hypothetical protein
VKESELLDERPVSLVESVKVDLFEEHGVKDEEGALAIPTCRGGQGHLASLGGLLRVDKSLNLIV